MGHEFSGIIEEVGEGVVDWNVGDRVSVQPIIYDGTCGACQDDLHNCCYSNGFIGLSGMDATSLVAEVKLMVTGWGGGLSEHIVVPTSTLYRLPKNVPLQVGGMRANRLRNAGAKLFQRWWSHCLSDGTILSGTKSKGTAADF